MGLVIFWWAWCFCIISTSFLTGKRCDTYSPKLHNHQVICTIQWFSKMETWILTHHPWVMPHFWPLSHFHFHTGSHANTKLSPYQFTNCLRTKLNIFQFSYGWDWSTLGELGVVVSFLHLFWQGKGVTPTSPSYTTIKSYAPSNDFQRWIHEP